MKSATSRDLSARVNDRVTAWRLVRERVVETESSVLVFGRRDAQQVALKVIKNQGDEWRSGEVLEAFRGLGVVRVYEHIEGAMLLERLTPGHSLAEMVRSGADENTTRVLAATIRAMSPHPLQSEASTVKDWGRGFDRYVASGDTQIASELVSSAHQVYLELCAAQTHVRLLHGDLHHENVLFDGERGWLAIDPKGVIGEIEYEVGAALRNPSERPDLFADPTVIHSRVDCFCRTLGLDAGRVQAWAFAQAVLSAIWAIEDGLGVEAAHGSLALAHRLRPTAESSIDPARAQAAKPTLISYQPDLQETVTSFFIDVWRESRFPLDPSGAHADLLRIPSEYQSMGGGFWLLLIREQVVGTVAVRHLPGNVAEVKRLNVLEAFRQQGFGTLLLRHAIGHARDAGFQTVRLDTIRNGGPAVRLFERHRFTEIPRYNDNPDADLFMELNLRSKVDV